MARQGSRCGDGQEVGVVSIHVDNVNKIECRWHTWESNVSQCK